MRPLLRAPKLRTRMMPDMVYPPPAGQAIEDAVNKVIPQSRRNRVTPNIYNEPFPQGSIRPNPNVATRQEIPRFGNVPVPTNVPEHVTRPAQTVGQQTPGWQQEVVPTESEVNRTVLPSEQTGLRDDAYRDVVGSDPRYQAMVEQGLVAPPIPPQEASFTDGPNYPVAGHSAVEKETAAMAAGASAEKMQAEIDFLDGGEYRPDILGPLPEGQTPEQRRDLMLAKKEEIEQAEIAKEMERDRAYGRMDVRMGMAAPEFIAQRNARKSQEDSDYTDFYGNYDEELSDLAGPDYLEQRDYDRRMEMMKLLPPELVEDYMGAPEMGRKRGQYGREPLSANQQIRAMERANNQMQMYNVSPEIIDANLMDATDIGQFADGNSIVNLESIVSSVSNAMRSSDANTATIIKSQIANTPGYKKLVEIANDEITLRDWVLGAFEEGLMTRDKMAVQHDKYKAAAQQLISLIEP